MVAAVDVGYQILNQLLKDKVSARNPPSTPQQQESEWVISINERLQKANEDDAAVASSWDRVSIYKIPRYIRDGGNDKAFAPQIVSLGPYHHQKRHLRQMERHKWRSLNHVLKRTKQDINLYLDSMKKIQEKARECYEGPIRTMSSTEFVEMLVLDGCFVLEILRGVAEKEGFEKLGYSNNDPVFSMNGWIHSIRNDMMMLENQLPLFVLERLLRLQLGKSKLNNYFKQLVSAFFEPLAPASEAGYPFDPLLSNQDGLHFLDVFRKNLLQRGARSGSGGGLIRSRVAHKRRQQLIHCVTELREAGVEFKKRETGRFWDIEFKNGIMRMPRLLIHDGTRSLFLNLIAFEQCHLDSSNDITSYVIFMDNLINSPADVGYLHYCGIIEHWLGSDGEVADMFNRLCQDVAIDNDNSYLSALSKEVHEYYKKRWHTWCATLRHNHFANPWAITSLVAGVVLLLLTFAQTFYTIYAYYRPPHTSSKP